MVDGVADKSISWSAVIKRVKRLDKWLDDTYKDHRFASIIDGGFPLDFVRLQAEGITVKFATRVKAHLWTAGAK